MCDCASEDANIAILCISCSETLLISKAPSPKRVRLLLYILLERFLTFLGGCIVDVKMDDTSPVITTYA